MISNMRKDIYAQINEKSKELEPYMQDPVFYDAQKIVEKYDFDLPKMSSQLDVNAVAQYTQLLVSGDKKFENMFKELTEWLNSLPKPPKGE